MSRTWIRQAEGAKAACQALSMMTREEKDEALMNMAKALGRAAPAVLSANRKDTAAARKKGISAAMIARLTLDLSKIEKIAAGIESVARLADPVGRLLWQRRRPNGLKIKKISVPLGSILIIYEARPNVTADCMALCLKSGNAVILKGGSEALKTNLAMFRAMSAAAIKAGVPRGAFQFVATADRKAVAGLLQLSGLIDLVIPRGGEGLIREVARLSKIPVIKHYKGVCHLYVDEAADLAMAERVVVNAKTQNPSVCNALECLLVHRKVAKQFLPRLAAVLKAKGVRMRADAAARAIVKDAERATAADWGAEYLDLVLAVKVVKDMEEAIRHITTYGSSHSDGIITSDKRRSLRFMGAVDSSAVFVNCSTRFNDGGEFGMGAEMGISTDKLHARGPMGLEELTSYKYLVEGDGQIRS